MRARSYAKQYFSRYTSKVRLDYNDDGLGVDIPAGDLDRWRFVVLTLEDKSRTTIYNYLGKINSGQNLENTHTHSTG